MNYCCLQTGVLKHTCPEHSPSNKNVEAFVLPSIITCNLASLAIAALYYTWRDVYLVRQRRQKTTNLHERVAHMLWVAANRN